MPRRAEMRSLACLVLCCALGWVSSGCQDTATGPAPCVLQEDCPAGQACFQGYCWPACGPEASCPDPLECVGQVCLRPCADDSACPAGQECHAGYCRPRATDPRDGADGDGDGGPVCIDQDQDGYGQGCPRGPDCDDTDRDVRPGALELCGNGRDDDCDGQTDEADCGCNPGARAACYEGPAVTLGVGLCRAGVALCQPDRTFGPCVGQVLPADEVCNGLDEDCDRQVDEGLLNRCGACLPLDAELVELCGNGLDDDCDGLMDEDCSCDPQCLCGEPGAGSNCTCHPPLHQPCYSGPPASLGFGVCRGGFHDCQAQAGGGWAWSACAGEVLPTAECAGGANGLDDDCDGATDEDADFVLQPELGAQATDGLDNNCNGLIDEPGGIMVPNRHYANTWIDAYEMTVFDSPDCGGARYGAAADDYPPTWPAGTGATVELYACSLPGLVPSGHLSFYRAARACQAQGKQLCSREMFLRACTDGQSMYFPYGFFFAEGQCNDPMVGDGHAVATGSYASCSVGNGTFDMSGNLAEWVSDDSLAHPGYSPLASWSFDRRVCWEGLSCYTADPTHPQDRDILIQLLDCDVENVRLDAYPRDTARPAFGARCCLERP